MCHIWIDKAMHGSEAWDLTPANLKMIRAYDTGRLATITGRVHHEEGDERTTTFDFCGHIRLKRLQWLGALPRLPAHRMVHKTVRARFDSATVPPGSILKDVPTTATFAELVAWAEDKKSWRQFCSDTFPRLCTSGQ